MAKREQEYKRLEYFYQMLVHYLDRPYSDAELGELLGTDRTNINRIRGLMSTLEIPIEKSTIYGKYVLPRDFQMNYIHFSNEELAALYLAARRLQQQTRTSQQHVEHALRKLANAMRKPFDESLTRSAGEVQAQEQDDQQRAVFSLLVQSWLEQTPVRIYHTKLHGARRDYVVHPYHIEPSMWNDGNYLIGYSEYHDKIARFKIARIDKVAKSTGKFREATDFDVHHFLQHAWGIWSTDEEPVTVRLRFRKWAIPRLTETVWPNATLSDAAADGSRIWEMPVAEWREMLPWVRSWGSDVEVLAPVELRDRILKDIRHLARRYGIVDTTNPKTPADAIAHTQNAAGERHNLLTHLHAVATMAAKFAEPFGGGELARYLGLWHDIGKFHPAFQTYLLEAEEDLTKHQRGPDHKAAGATVALDHQVPLANLLIQAHHGGLQTIEDFKRWYESRKDAAAEAIAIAREAESTLCDLSIAPTALFPERLRKDPHAAEFFLRFVFSALVDADFLDTEQHFSPERNIQRQMHWSIDTLWQRVEEQQAAFTLAAESTLVNQLRQEVYTACLKAAMLPPGLFRLTVPTGGGKTRSGLAFALRHAKEHGLRRVIIAVPFITITEQTAAVYRSMLEADADAQPIVLEHHSGAVEAMSDQDGGVGTVWNRLAAENWDAPVVVTTTVQLFESLFASGTSRCRKLHRLAGSVIILDEAQALPMGMLDPILSALRELCMHYGSTVVLSTATQPAFELIEPFRALSATEIVPGPERYFDALSRVTYEWRVDTQQSWPEIAEWMQAEEQVLTIVNTKKDALALLDALDDPDALHLSTLLCGAHRRVVIATIKERLQMGKPCRVVSTQVVEAGVDIDFPVVMRAFGPLDSMIQAAGRANREGRLPTKGRVIIFDPAEGGSPRGSYHIAKESTRTFLHAGAPDMDDPTSVTRYFELYYPLDNSDKEGIQPLRKTLNYPEVNQRFKLIDEDTVSVVVPYASKHDEIDRLIEKLYNQWGNRRTILRQLQPYLVSLRSRQANEYRQKGFIADILVDENRRLLVGQWTGAYDAVRGLTATDMDADQLII